MFGRKGFFLLYFAFSEVCFCDAESPSAIEMDKYVKGLGFGKRSSSANDLDKYMKVLTFGKRPNTAVAMDKFVKQLTLGKRAEIPDGQYDNLCENCAREKKSFASFRWRPADG